MSNWVADYLSRNGGEVVQRARHALHVRQGHSIVAHVVGSPIHHAENGEWKAIDTALIRDAGRGELYAPGLDIRIKDDGTVVVGGYSQQAGRIGTLTDVGKVFTTRRNLPAGVVDGDRFVRETSIYRHVLRLTPTGLREELAILSAPTIADDDWLVIETAQTGSLQGYDQPPPDAWDARRQSIPVRQHTVGGRLYTGVQGKALAGVTYPVTIDPDILTNASDARVWGASTVYATARSTGNAHNTAASINVGQIFATPNYTVSRGFLNFNTSSIAPNVPTEVRLRMSFFTDDSATDFDVQVVKYNWSAEEPIAAGTRDAAFDGVLAADADDNILFNTNGLSIDTVYTSGALSTAWVNTAGNTYYGLRSSLDLANTAPTGNEIIYFYSANNGTPNYVPTLVVTYPASPSTGTSEGRYRRQWRMS